MGEAEDKPRMFSVSEAALLLGISESYLTNALEHEHSLYPRRNQRGERVYSAADIAILRRMGVGQRPRRLRSEDVAQELGFHAFFGFDPPKGSLKAPQHARRVKLLEQVERGGQPEASPLSEYFAYLSRIQRADERTRTAYPCSSYE